MFTAALDRLESALAGRLQIDQPDLHKHYVELESLVRETLDELIDAERSLRQQYHKRQASALTLYAVEIPTSPSSSSMAKRTKKRPQPSASPSTATTAKKFRPTTHTTLLNTPPASTGRTSLTSAVARASDSVASLRAMMLEAERLINSGNI